MGVGGTPPVSAALGFIRRKSSAPSTGWLRIDLALAPGTPSNTARSGGTIFPIVQQIPPLYGSEPGPTAGRIGTFVM